MLNAPVVPDLEGIGLSGTLLDSLRAERIANDLVIRELNFSKDGRTSGQIGGMLKAIRTDQSSVLWPGQYPANNDIF